MSGFSFPPPPPPPPKPAQSQQYQQARGSERGRGIPRGGRGPRGNHTSSIRGNHHSSGYGQTGFPPQSNWQHTATQNQGQAYQRPNLSSGAFVNPNFGSSQYNLNRDNESAYPPRTEAGHKRKLDALRGQTREKKPAPPTAPSVPSFGAAFLPSKPSPAGKAAPSQNHAPAKTSPAKRSLGLTPATENPQYSSSESGDENQHVDEEAAHAELGNKLAFEHNGVLVSLNSQADLAAWKKERQKHWPTKQRMAEKYREKQRIGDERKRLLAHTQPLERSERVREWKAPAVHDSGAVVGSAGSDSVQSALLEDQSKTELQKVKDEVADKTKQLEDLRRRVKESEARNREARAQQTPSIDRSTENDHEAIETDTSVPPRPPQITEAEPLEEAAAENVADGSQASSDESSSVISSDSPSEVDSDDEAPEEVSTKLPCTGTPGKPATVCRYFAASAYCRDGDTCMFKHERPPQRPRGDGQLHPPVHKPQQSFAGASSNRMKGDVQRKGIFERLLEQQQGEEDKLALKVIKYLGSVGFFKEDDIAEAA